MTTGGDLVPLWGALLCWNVSGVGGARPRCVPAHSTFAAACSQRRQALSHGQLSFPEGARGRPGQARGTCPARRALTGSPLSGSVPPRSLLGLLEVECGNLGHTPLLCPLQGPQPPPMKGCWDMPSALGMLTRPGCRPVSAAWPAPSHPGQQGSSPCPPDRTRSSQRTGVSLGWEVEGRAAAPGVGFLVASSPSQRAGECLGGWLELPPAGHHRNDRSQGSSGEGRARRAPSSVACPPGHRSPGHQGSRVGAPRGPP